MDPPYALESHRSHSLIPIIVTRGEWVGAKDSLIQPTTIEGTSNASRKLSVVKKR
jgi:hypothetical protein